ncbi:MAG: 50S ribosomal protein L16 [Acholeplasmatales bacterium]|jgi:large subunit ribosomal protein L16|nr:50S ribosomal protein L16 [Acholeplasmatales bacterium]
MLQPKRTKFRRPHRVSYEGHVKGKNIMVNGDFGLVALEGAWVTSRQIEAARIAMTRHMKRLGMVWINIFPHLAKTKKPLEVRMGSGKGAPDHYVAVVKRDKIMFEINGVSPEIAREALRLASYKLSIKSKIIVKGADE